MFLGAKPQPAPDVWRPGTSGRAGIESGLRRSKLEQVRLNRWMETVPLDYTLYLWQHGLCPRDGASLRFRLPD
jgi:hypothetical protein